MAWKNPADKLAWRRRYSAKNRDKILVWKDNAKRKYAEENKDAIEKRETAKSLAKAKRDQESILKDVAGAIGEIRIRILQRDGLCKCSTCGEVKPYSSMKSTQGKRKLTGYCRKCSGLPDTKDQAKEYLCNRCRRSLPRDMFDIYISSGIHKAYCRECHRAGKQTRVDKKNSILEDKLRLIKNGVLTCRVCGKTKKLSLFPRAALRPQTRYDRCSSCCSAASKNRYYSLTKERRREMGYRYFKNRMKDPIVKLKHVMRNRLSCAMRRALKCKPYSGSRVIEFIGCTPEELKKYLEAQFTNGMSWDNFGKWEIDHVFPLCKFDITNYEEMRKAWHYTNLRPLWAIENRRKHAKVMNQYQPILKGLF